MSGEKMAILKMLEEGKITAESATKLLAALNEESSQNGGGSSSAASQREPGSQRRPSDSDTRGASSRWSSDLNNLSQRIGEVARDLEPKIQKVAGVLIEKSVEMADAATKSFQSARERNAERAESAEKERPAKYGAEKVRVNGAGFEAERKPRSAAKGAAAKTFELSVSPDLPNEIILKSPKGSINVKGYNGDKVTVNISYVKSVMGTELDFLKLGCVYQINCDADAFEAISMDVFLPSALFKRISIETSEGDVSLDNIDAETIMINTSKCQVSVKNVNAGRLKIDNIDGAVLLSNSSGDELLAENANGTIEAVNTDFKSLKLETTAEAVSVISQGFYKYSSYEWIIRTSNARLKASLPVSADLGYDIKAYTSLADVSNGLSGISYTRNDRNCIEGKSDNFEAKPKKARIVLDTSNAPLYIN